MIFRRGVSRVLSIRLQRVGAFRRYFRRRADFLLRSQYSVILPTQARFWVKTQFARITRVSQSLAPARTRRPVGLIPQPLLRPRPSLSETSGETQSMVPAGKPSTLLCNASSL